MFRERNYEVMDVADEVIFKTLVYKPSQEFQGSPSVAWWEVVGMKNMELWRNGDETTATADFRRYTGVI